MAFWDNLRGRRESSAATTSILEREMTREKTRADRQWKRILVPAVGQPYSSRGVEMALRLARGTNATVHFVYILEVPRSLALNAIMPEEESIAREVLGEVRATAAQSRIPFEAYVHPVRDARDGLLKLIDQDNFDLLVLGSRPDEVRGMPNALTRELFLRARCEVVVDYIASEK